MNPRKSIITLFMLISVESSTAIAQNASISDIGKAISQLSLDDLKRELVNPTSFPGCKDQFFPNTQTTYLVTHMDTGVDVLIAVGKRSGGINILRENGGPTVCAKLKTNIPLFASMHKNGYGDFYVDLKTLTRAGTLKLPVEMFGDIPKLVNGFDQKSSVRVTLLQ